MGVFTVYCHGTGFNRVKGTEKDELVAWFHNHTDGVEARLGGSLVTPGDYLINEGPGHGGSGGIALPQQVNPISGDARSKGSGKPSFLDHLRGQGAGKQHKLVANLSGNVEGTGWDENVTRTVNVIQDLKFEHGKAIDTVNLLGWSRGAVTCIRIAHKLHEVFGTDIGCNIIAVDPVAGQDAGIKMTDTRVLHANVKRYIGILAMHEMRETFRPQDWSRMTIDPATEVVMLPMPGVHNAQVIVGNPRDAAHVSRNLVHALLDDWGTSLNGKPFAHLNTPAEMCEAYGRLVLSLSEHKSYQTQSGKNTLIGKGLRRREFAKHSKMDTYTRGGKESYWINEHHRACFAAAFPDAYDAIFERLGKGEQLVSAVDFRLWKALADKTALRQSLQSKGLLSAEPPYSIEVGGGNYGNGVLGGGWPKHWPLNG